MLRAAKNYDNMLAASRSEKPFAFTFCLLINNDVFKFLVYAPAELRKITHHPLDV